MTEMINKIIRIIEISAIIGKEIAKNKSTFHVGYSKISLLEIRESKNRNIRNTKKGKNMMIPIPETMVLG